jgi:uncharacterized protein YecE (DUF72 family)
MGTRFHIGGASLRGAITAYAKRFDLLEVPLSSGVRGPAPTLATLRKWRKSVPPHFEFAVVGGKHISLAKAGPELDAEIEEARATIAALQARCFVVRTPAEVTPSQASRERLRKVFAEFPQDATYAVWEPGGLWEVGDAALQARKWGVAVAVDASRDPVPVGPVAYVRLRALGETRSYGAAALERVVRAIGPRRDAYVVLDTESALTECKTLRRIAQNVSLDDEGGGMGRLVRPRGGIVVRDDEQE